MSGDLYETIAPYYDLLHDTLTQDLDLILALAAEAGDPILELGCGTGRLLRPLVRAGHQVTGLDSSLAMLARARARLADLAPQQRPSVQLVAADMIAPPLLREHFRLALVSYNTFLHLPPELTLRACRAIQRHLQPDGRLFLDLVNPLLVEHAQDERAFSLEQAIVDEATGSELLVFAGSWLEAAAQILHITWVYDRSPAGGGPVQRTVSRLAYHYYYPHQLELMLQNGGFALEGIYGDYEQGPFEEDSERLLVLARRR
ncbi:MAG TPA: class I SAM-dependent methyltransferase [Candidatus Sulfomarinibacteraceae bacterium]|nr:class I SAM-dependent methyltransferase [Candidatus Sulfomarinibacteraceae bacterium]